MVMLLQQQISKIDSANKTAELLCATSKAIDYWRWININLRDGECIVGRFVFPCHKCSVLRLAEIHAPLAPRPDPFNCRDYGSDESERHHDCYDPSVGTGHMARGSMQGKEDSKQGWEEV